MNRIVRVLAGLFLVLVVLASAGCSKLQARDQLNKGVQSYKNARYEEAIEHFKNAVSLDPALLNARIYLATAYAQQYVPGAETDDNKRYASQAIDEYKKVLAADPGNINSVKGIAYLYLQEKELRPGQAVLQQGGPDRSQRSGILLLGRLHRLVPGLQIPSGRAQQTRHEGHRRAQ